MTINKKILFIALLFVALTFPVAIYAADQVSVTMGNLKQGFITIGAAVVVIGWIVAGILYLTAAGGPRMEVAKKALIAAVIGTVLIIIAVSAETFIAGVFKLGGAGGDAGANGGAGNGGINNAVDPAGEMDM